MQGIINVKKLSEVETGMQKPHVLVDYIHLWKINMGLIKHCFMEYQNTMCITEILSGRGPLQTI